MIGSTSASTWLRAASSSASIASRRCGFRYFLSRFIAGLRAGGDRAADARGASRGAVFLQAQLALHGIADPEFLNLARHRHREGVNEADVARDLVMRDLAAAEGAHLLLGESLAGLADDPGAKLLAVLA